MAAEADRVVVELVAENTKFDAAVRQSAAGYQQSMKQIETSGGAAETSHKRLTASVGNSRIAMLEFQHIARGTADQIAAGAPLTQVLAQHMGMLGQAISLAGGAFGRVGAFLSGPWGLALTVAAAGVATLIMRHKEETDTVEGLLKKLQEHHDKAVLNAQANDIWKHSIDGVIESERNLADQLERSLTVQSVAQRQAVESAQALVALRGVQAVRAEEQFGATDPRAIKAQQAFHEAVRILQADLLKFGEQEGAALSDLTARSEQWADRQTVIIRSLQTMHPELTQFGGDINAAFTLMKKAVSDAAGANVPFDNVTRQVDVLNNKLAQSPNSVREYVAELRKLAAQLERTAEEAKKLGKIDPVAQFKGALIGAEGVGPNRMGSSAAGFGQFMPGTFLHYFSQAYPDQASLPRDYILSLRNNKQVAEGVIDTATKDYVAVLQRAGQQITAAALYTMHLLSAGDPNGRTALRLLNAPAGEQTSSFLSAGVLSGNSFLRGTAGDARAAIAKRIGDSSPTVSQGSVAIENTLASLRERESERLSKDLHTEQEVLVTKEHQRDLADQLYGKHSDIYQMIATGILPALKDWEKEYEQIKNSQEELNRFGAEMVDDILNPDNWAHWGDAGKRILHELEMEIFRLAAINPLKNLLFGSKLPTLLSGLTSLFGGGGGLGEIPSVTIGSATLPAIPAMATGGTLPVRGSAGDTNVLSINGQARAMVAGDETIAVIPNNTRAIAPGSSAPPGYVHVLVEASRYFDGRVLEVSGPVTAQASVAAANGGASIARRNLGREQLHRLE